MNGKVLGINLLENSILYNYHNLIGDVQILGPKAFAIKRRPLFLCIIVPRIQEVLAVKSVFINISDISKIYGNPRAKKWVFHLKSKTKLGQRKRTLKESKR